ncbi:MAG: 4Fe-4S dicluster domain-containing protein [Planctomycetes bacterium]|nr:4Fe-4S dicluster domain-containing protein [Planctomycetota bacterium]
MSVFIPLGALDDAIIQKIAEISGENARRCMQCGTCSAVCPMVESMQPSVRQLMLLLQHGRSGAVQEATTAWTCAACHTCLVRCPRGIDIPRLMEGIRQIVLRQNLDRVDPRAIPAETLAALPPIALVAAFRKLTA